MQLNQFRALLAMVPSESAANPDLFPPEELRFVLESTMLPDLHAQSAAVAALLHTQAFTLAPLADGCVVERFTVLRFAGLERTLNNHDLFELSYALCDALHLVSVEPDLGTDFYVDPEDPIGALRETAFVEPLCQVSTVAPEDRLWSLRTIFAQAAWKKSQGAGILIGHPDTGIAKHRELEGDMFDLARGLDLIDGSNPPEDSLRSGMANPGHGTATSSVIASRHEGNIDGVAPLATIVPIRCIEDVKVFNQAPVAAAIAHAHKVGCHVISMSLGGVPSRAMHAAVTAAISDGVIVLAAAGNCVRTVVWPARYSEVIAVAGSNINDIPWRGSCRGAAVDICAPGEQVWCAKRSQPDEDTTGVKAGQGTSYAVATIAGVAALWLGTHTPEAVRKEAKSRGIPVQELFKIVLQTTARRIKGWDSDNFGPGIVDAEAVVNLALADIPVPLQHELAYDPARSTRAMLADEYGVPGAADRFDWNRYGSELAAISLAQAKAGASLAELTRESKTTRTRPSAQLARAVDDAGLPSLRKFGMSLGGMTAVSRPLVNLVRPSWPEVLRHAIAAVPGAGLESSAGAYDGVRTGAYLQGGGVQEQLTRVEGILSTMGTVSHALRSKVLDGADEAIKSTLGGTHLTARAIFGLEALVALTGRPALRAVGGAINLDDPRASEWHDRLYMPLKDRTLAKAIAAVGRIDDGGRHVGTGFVIAPGLILTNRHVLQEIAVSVPSRNFPTGWLLEGDDITINFADAPGAATEASSFRIKSVVAWGERYIEELGLELTRLDAAILEVERVNAAGAELPAPLVLSDNRNRVGRYAEVVTIGYPARPGSLPRTPAGEVDTAVADRLAELFDEYSVKYVSPGEIMVAPTFTAGDEHMWTMRYDATTLGGSSGSCVVALAPGLGVVGLHFGGSWMRANFAHALAAVRSSWPGLDAAGVTWK
ncbi:S8 family serine peptidase [Massilia genomosp. 1]|uniref:S8 family serine peptidase n=1 Tax=Massilia genomosp. 1 TaxID=2609280 RepID=A0ABX0MMT3_9BURK|nr:S8 family serine peptidase [Massilia genomosp. 1]NHZ64082.1 S8 family serine peptidase [Massilia genomosp. 1]